MCILVSYFIFKKLKRTRTHPITHHNNSANSSCARLNAISLSLIFSFALSNCALNFCAVDPLSKFDTSAAISFLVSSPFFTLFVFVASTSSSGCLHCFTSTDKGSALIGTSGMTELCGGRSRADGRCPTPLGRLPSDFLLLLPPPDLCWCWCCCFCCWCWCCCFCCCFCCCCSSFSSVGGG